MTTSFTVHQDLTNPHYVAWLDFLKSSEQWTPDEIGAYQLHELQRVVKHAYESTRAYRANFDAAGVTPNALYSLDDIRQFPFSTKEQIRDQLEDYSAPLQEREYITTGGSTGIPFGFYRDKVSFGRELASKAYQYYRVGWKEGDRQLVFRGLPIETPDHTIFVPEFNELRCSSYYLVPEWMEIYRQKAWEYQPDWLRCYPSSGYLFARFLKDTGRSFPRIKGVLCASENLYDFQKELMREIFGARIFSHYGHYEMSVLAGFCETADTYHVLPQYGYAELCDAQGQPVDQPGQMGEVVATSFIMSATPFIRYRTRDYAVLQGWQCPACGRPYQIWSRIEGRLQEFIVTGAGRYISMTAINMHDDVFDHIRQFQFYQETPGQVVFRYIPAPTCSEAIVQDAKRRLLVKLGTDIDVVMQPVEDIPLTKRGKHRFLIQKLQLDVGDV